MTKYKYMFGAVAIGLVTALEITAMIKGVNGQTFATAIGAICAISAGVIGYAAGLKNKGS